MGSFLIVPYFNYYLSPFESLFISYFILSYIGKSEIFLDTLFCKLYFLIYIILL